MRPRPARTLHTMSESVDPQAGQDLARREALVDRWFDGTGASYDRVVAWTTLGLDGYWKRRMLAVLPERATRVLDLACGTGIVLERLARRYPDAELVGVDLTREYLDVAGTKLGRKDIDARLIHANAETVAFDGRFDVVSASYLPKYVDAERLLANLTPHVAPGGTVVMHDFTYPKVLLLRWAWYGWMRLLATAGRRVFPAWDKAFDDELLHFIVRSRWPRSFVRAFEQHGYVDVTCEPVSGRMATIVSARRAGTA